MSTSTQYVSWDNQFTSNASVRSNMSAFYTALESIGWTQSADTGQADQTTVTTSALTNNTSTTAYQIHYFDDDLHATSPIYLKTAWVKEGYIDAYLLINFSLGTGTNGAGTLTGPTVSVSSVSGSTFGPAVKYVRLDTTYSEGKYSGLFLNGPETNTSLAEYYAMCSFFFARTVDLSEDADGVGAIFYGSKSNRYVTQEVFNGTAWAETYNYSFVTGNRPYSPPEGFAAFRHWYIAENKYNLMPYMVTVMNAEMALDQELTVTPGTIPHRYRKLGLPWPSATYQGSTPSTTLHYPAVIWE